MTSRPLALVGLMLILSFALAPGLSAAPPQDVSKPSVRPAEPVKVRGEPQNFKERTAVYVLLAWVWLSVGVLLWLLRLKVREADRVFRMRLYPFPDKKSSRPQTR